MLTSILIPFPPKLFNFCQLIINFCYFTYLVIIIIIIIIII